MNVSISDEGTDFVFVTGKGGGEDMGAKFSGKESCMTNLQEDDEYFLNIFG
jgi:hypothetical protein